jgi:hypothetical protein
MRTRARAPITRDQQARFGAKITQWQAERLGRGGVILGEILGQHNRAVSHVAHRDPRDRRLLLDEGPKIGQLAAEVDTATIINEDG